MSAPIINDTLAQLSENNVLIVSSSSPAIRPLTTPVSAPRLLLALSLSSTANISQSQSSYTRLDSSVKTSLSALSSALDAKDSAYAAFYASSLIAKQIVFPNQAVVDGINALLAMSNVELISTQIFLDLVNELQNVLYAELEGSSTPGPAAGLSSVGVLEAYGATSPSL